MNSPADNDVMLQVQDGQVDRLNVLFERYNVRLFNYFLMLTSDRPLSEDLTQEVFLRILRFRHTFKGKGTFISWMFQIARNVGIDHYRRRKNTGPLDDELYAMADNELTPFEESAQKQEIEILHRALHKISPKNRELLILARFEDMPLKDIAAILKCPVNTVKVRIHRAVKELGAAFQELAGVL